MILLDLLIIQTLVCFVIDLSGFIPEIEDALRRLFKVRIRIPKPFSCALCAGWWINLIYLLCTGYFTLPYIAFVAGLSFFSKNITGILRWIQEMLIKIESLLYKIIR